MGLELVPDPGFDDPSAWNIDGLGPPFNIPASNVEISTSQLKSTSSSCLGIVTPVVPVTLVTGKSYQWEIDVESASGGGTITASVDNLVLWSVASNVSIGATTVTGVFIYAGVSGLQIRISNKLVSINKVSIMADAREEQILAAVTTAVTGLTTTGTNVFRGRAYPLDPATDTPGLLVFMGPDAPDVELFNNYIDWSLGVGIEAYVYTSSATIDTELAQIRKEVHTAIMTTPQFGLSFVIDTAPISAAEPEIDGDGAKRTGRRRFEFVVRYRSSRTDISA